MSNLDQEYVGWLRRYGFEPKLNGIWALVGKPSATYGWKLHVSSIQVEAIELLRHVVPVLAHLHVPFKVAKGPKTLGFLNEGGYGATQVGKFLTVYPNESTDCAGLARRLVSVTTGRKGPRIVTDAHLGGTVYVRYGSHSPHVRRDRLGNIYSDEPEEAKYSVPYRLPKNSPFVGFGPIDEERNEKQITDGSNPILGGRYLLLRPLATHAKGSVYLALDVSSQQEASVIVLKEARSHCMSDDAGRDMRERLRNQFRLHQLLRDSGCVPFANEIFTYGENDYLPLSFVEGRDFVDRPALPFFRLSSSDQERTLTDLTNIVDGLERLHAKGVVHRDLSPRNIRITPNGAAYFLDLEIAHAFSDATLPFTLGTKGFISPQQERNGPPTTADDVYSLGALIIFAVAGIDPRRLPLQSYVDLEDRLYLLSGAPRSICSIAARCVEADPVRRPQLNEIGNALGGVRSVQKNAPSVVDPVVSMRDRIVGADFVGAMITRAVSWMVQGGRRDSKFGLWVSPSLESTNHQPVVESVESFLPYRSCSRGVGGVVYVLSRLHRIGYRHPGAPAIVERAIDWLLSHQATPDDQLPGLHFGEAGVALAIAEAIVAGLATPGAWTGPYFEQALLGRLDWPDLTHGAAGQGVSAIEVAALLDSSTLKDKAARCADYLMCAQKSDGSWELPPGVIGLEGAVFSGFAHGVAGAVYFLSTYSRLWDDSRAKSATMAGGEYLRKTAIGNGVGMNWRVSNSDTSEWSWWCHGAPGVALAWMALYRLTNAPQFRKLTADSLSWLPSHVGHSNLSQCHGLSGLGEIFLEAYSVLGDVRFLKRAERIVAQLLALARREQAGASWLVENPFEPTADLMIGCAGVAHFLARYVEALAGRYIGYPLLVSR